MEDFLDTAGTISDFLLMLIGYAVTGYLFIDMMRYSQTCAESCNPSEKLITFLIVVIVINTYSKVVVIRHKLS